MKNYYEILEVNKKASKEVIEKAYKVLVKKYHPDLYSGIKQEYAEKKMKEINEAYNILSDDFLREQYNNELEKQEMESRQKNYQNPMQTEKNTNNARKEQKEEKLNFVVYNQQDCMHFPLTAQSTLLTAQGS